ncbi:Nac domain-containing protein [Thalictrum thalictroides]|uniref:Nac domain-containing protein n=1 Tax=Thalictrum thalictroides TaxID=46969 RepID=A0A7J6VXS3_THATH|nr:Nac domain-containing protein [Thalictrum thalictroides]
MENTSVRVKVDVSTSVNATSTEAVVANANADVKLDEDEKFLRSFPPGYRFAPRDDELLEHYLVNKLANRKLPINSIKDVNIYKFNPQDVVEEFKIYGEREKEWYFFTPRDRKYPNGNRPNRAAGDGYWKATGADRKIYSQRTKTMIGCKKALVFYNGRPGPGDGKKTKWIMHEYRIEGETPRNRLGLHDMRLDDWVLCKIYEKDESKESKATKVKVVTNKRKKNGSKKKNDKDEPLEVLPKEDPSNSNPTSSSVLESNDNQWSSVESDNEPVFDADGKEHLMAICAGMGISDPYSEYFMENPNLSFQNAQSFFSNYYSTYQEPTRADENNMLNFPHYPL